MRGAALEAARILSRRLRWAAPSALAALSLAAPALAGPPYVTDDPQPTEQGHWEIYAYVGGAHAPGETAGEGGLDLNYGGAKDLQLTVVIPAAFSTAGADPIGMGVIEAAAKYKILHQDEHGWMPDLAVFPRLFIPTASSQFAATRPNLLLPVWAEKDFGPWSVFGGGGYQLNPGSANRNFWVSGLVVTRQVNERLNLGAEVFHQTPETIEGKPLTGINVGVIYKVADHWALLASGGPGIQNRDQGQYDFYLSLQLTY